MVIDETQKKALEEQHGEVLVLETDHGDLAFRMPTQDEYNVFLDQIHDEEMRTRATRTLISISLVVPDKEGLAAILKKRPGLVTPLGNQLTEWAGLQKSAVRKK